jgi:nucleoside-diphosphate-sugar epimerase
MRIAILGATSQIARDTVTSLLAHSDYRMALFARRADAVQQWTQTKDAAGRVEVAEFAALRDDDRFDAVLNFVGVGNPAKTVAMGASILDVTTQYDDLALGYVQRHPGCKYIFLSSGAAYGAHFDEPANAGTEARVPINALAGQDWYSVAKMYAEVRHRARPDLPIVDLRVFNYFSHTQDLSARFLITDLVRAVKSGETLKTSPLNIVRDFIGPDDFHSLVRLVLEGPPRNDVFDCYTKEPVDKMTLLQKMRERFGLSYEVEQVALVNGTGVKPNYYSLNRRAESIGYLPSKTSLQTVLDEAARCI